MTELKSREADLTRRFIDILHIFDVENKLALARVNQQRGKVDLAYERVKKLEVKNKTKPTKHNITYNNKISKQSQIGSSLFPPFSIFCSIYVYRK